MTKEEKKKLKKKKLAEKAKANKKSGKFKKVNLLFNILFGMFLMISAYLIYNLLRLTGIENLIRYIVVGLLIVIDLGLLIKWFRTMNRPLFTRYLIFLLIVLAGGTLEYFIAFTINKGLNVVDNISVGKYKTYSTSLVALKDGNLSKVSDITSDTKIGRVKNEKDVEGYILTKDLIKKDKIDSEIVDYDDPISMLYDLYDKKIDAVFIASSYNDTYRTMDKFENIEDETIVLDSFKKKMKVQKESTVVASTKSITEPFTILLMGVDSTAENLSESSGLGDSLMLITFNPDTLNATILSIPRDTFVPITCYRNVNSKITHAASGGDKCMINTIQNFFDVDINYYVKINFKGLVKIVDAIGGVYADVPYSFCEQDSERRWDAGHVQYVLKGYQKLNGEQALALSRNRKTTPSCGSEWNKGERNDFIRGQNQQLVINGIINQAKSMDNITQFYNLLEAVGNSMTTNMDRKQILSFYNVFKNILINSKDLTDGNNIINMQKMYLNGSGAYIKDGIMNMNLYEYVPSTESLNEIKKAMRINLELEDDEPSYSFSFSIDEEYTQKVIGKDKYGGVKKYETLEESSTDTAKTCDTNEELGADNETCVCKAGYERKDGKCQKPKVEDITCTNGTITGSSCTCWKGYSDDDGDGICTKDEEEEIPPQPPIDDSNSNDTGTQTPSTSEPTPEGGNE